MKWFDRKFAFDLPPWMAPNVIERLRGTPARLEDRLNGIEAERMVFRMADQWTAQEQVGHLLDLEPLWLGRVEDICQGIEMLRVADLENQKTHEANHNERPLIFLLSEFRKQRKILIDRLENLSRDDFVRTARHPRLLQPMRMLDLLFFVAEHDDHHLATITQLLSPDLQNLTSKH